jgi:hypothetical protein
MQSPHHAADRLFAAIARNDHLPATNLLQGRPRWSMWADRRIGQPSIKATVGHQA